MARAIQVSILSDSRVFRDALSFSLTFENEIRLVAVAATVRELITKAPARSTEVLLVDLSVQPADAAEIIWDLKTCLPTARVIALGCEHDETETVKCIEAGASACLGQDVPYDVLLETVRAVSEERTIGSLRILTRVVRRIDKLAAVKGHVEDSQPRRLSRRETEVARLVGSGMINKQIARQLAIKPCTVKSHVHSILHKLGVGRRRDVAKRIYEHCSFEEGFVKKDVHQRC